MKRLISLLLITTLLFTLAPTVSFASKKEAVDLLRNKTISELIKKNEIESVGIYSLDRKQYNAYQVKYSRGPLSPYAIFTDTNNQIVSNPNITSKLYEIYYLHNVLDVEASLEVMNKYKKTTSVFYDFEFIKSYVSIIGTFGTAIINPKAALSALKKVGVNEFSKMFSSDNIIRTYFSMMYEEHSRELFDLYLYLRDSQNLFSYSYESELEYIKTSKESILTVQSIVEFLEASVAEDSKDAKWYDLYKIAFSSFVGNYQWSTAHRKVDLKKVTDFVLKSETVLEAIIENEGVKSKDGVLLINEFTVKLQELIDDMAFIKEFNDIKAERGKRWRTTYETYASASASNVVKSEKKVNVYTNNKEIVFTLKSGYPFIVDGRTYLPLKIISDNLDLQTYWSPSDKTVIVSDGLKKLSLSVGKQDYRIVTTNGEVLKTIPLDVPPLIIDGRMYLPIGAVLKEYGYKVEWFNSTFTLKISE